MENKKFNDIYDLERVKGSEDLLEKIEMVNHLEEDQENKVLFCSN